MQRKIPAVYMRGGTSKGLFFHARHLPEDPVIRDRVILGAYGSPDPYGRQTDGVGGGTSVSSKVAIVGPARSSEADVNYLFGQVSIDRPIVDYRGSCGNILSAVGPFAVDEGLVKAAGPLARIRIFQENTRKLIISEFPLTEGRFEPSGDYAIDGVPSPGSHIKLRFLDPGGSLTGSLFPTGKPRDILSVDGLGRIDVTIIDAANPVVFVPATTVGLIGTEIEEIDENAELKTALENIRCAAGLTIGLDGHERGRGAKSQSVPKVAVVAAPAGYRTMAKKFIDPSSIDLTARILSMGSLHRSFATTGAIATAGAAKIPGTVVNAVVKDAVSKVDRVRIGHPSGVIAIDARMSYDHERFVYREAALGRTARRLMEGMVLVPEGYLV